jgi:hypothetical protein
MGIDNFSFSNKNLEVKKYNGPPAEICDCGLAWSNHTIKGRRKCRLERIREETEEDSQSLHGVC